MVVNRLDRRNPDPKRLSYVKLESEWSAKRMSI
jgi:hypothetical protein